MTGTITPTRVPLAPGAIDAIKALEKQINHEWGKRDLPYRANLTLMHWAAAYGDDVVIAALREAAPDVSEGVDAMHFAAREGHVNVIMALKRAGADVSAKTNKESTPIHWLAGRGHINAIKVLNREGDGNLC
jgi:Ankyrin repeats (many copies)